MIKIPRPDSPVFSELKSLVGPEANELCAVIPPETLEDIAKAILAHKAQMAEEAWVIGRLLLAAKEKLTVHGEWLHWLSYNVDIPEWTAERCMKLAREYPNPTAPSILGLTKAMAITKIPHSDRSAFLQELHSIDGQKKTVVQMTTRELEKSVKDWVESGTADADDYVIPPIHVSHGTGKYDEDDVVRWDRASSDKFAAELDTMQTHLQEMATYMTSMKRWGFPSKQCVEKLHAIYIKMRDCLSLAGEDMKAE